MVIADRAPTPSEPVLAILIPDPSLYPGVYMWENTSTNQFWMYAGGESTAMEWVQIGGAGADTRTYNYPSRSFNTVFQPSTTNDTHVTYSVLVTVNSLLLGSYAGAVHLEYADDSEFTTNVQTVWYMPLSASGLSLSSSLPIALTVSGEIPDGKYAKLISSVSSGSMTFNVENVQEVQE